MLNWIVAHPDFGLVRKDASASASDKHASVLRGITKKARIKFKEFHRGTLKRFHKEMRRQHKKSVRSRMATPVAGYVPAYLMK
jgi:hypothetical protein